MLTNSEQSLKSFIESGFGKETIPLLFTPKPGKVFTVAYSQESPYRNMNSYCTFGLSNFPIKDSQGEFDFRVELLMGSNIDSSNYSKLLVEISKYYIYDKALLPGTAMKNSVLDSGLDFPKLPHAYVTMPFGWKHKFEVLNIGNYDVRFLLVFPISENESQYLIKNGKDNFENLLEKNNIDVFNFHRKSCR